MENNNVRPSFGVGTVNNSGEVNRVSAPPSPELKAARDSREEIGAVWRKTGNASGKEFITIKLNLTREKLTELLATIPVGTNETSVNLVGFQNAYQEGNSRRPAWRLFEELNRENI